MARGVIPVTAVRATGTSAPMLSRRRGANSTGPAWLIVAAAIDSAVTAAPGERNDRDRDEANPDREPDAGGSVSEQRVAGDAEEQRESERGGRDADRERRGGVVSPRGIDAGLRRCDQRWRCHREYFTTQSKYRQDAIYRRRRARPDGTGRATFTFPGWPRHRLPFADSR